MGKSEAKSEQGSFWPCRSKTAGGVDKGENVYVIQDDLNKGVTAGTSFRDQLLNRKGSQSQELNKDPALEVEVSEMVLQELECSWVGFLSFHREIKELQTSLLMEGIRDIEAVDMGDGMILLRCTVVGKVAKSKLEHKLWWNYTFKKTSPWSPQLVAKRKRAWVNLMGIPLHVWDERFFKLAGGKFGEFLDFDVDTVERNRLDSARILISTYRMSFIDEWLKISMMGSIFNI